MNDRPLVLNDPQAPSFAVNRATMVDPEILELERRRVFDTCWIYVGHESEVRAPGDFKTRSVCGRPVIFSRDGKNNIRVFLNTCRHRGAMVCREAEGNAKIYTCFYHGWSYDRDGRLDGVPGENAYPKSFKKSDYGLAEPPRVESYRGFVFLNFDPGAVPLAEYLAGAKKQIDLVIDYVNFRGRPVANWSPVYGEAAKPEIERTRAELVARLGEARAARVADTNRNLVVFPNLVLNDGSSVTVRTFHPLAPDRMRVLAWALGPKEETPTARAVRLDAFLTFYGPGGLATPDDIDALEMVQAGISATCREVPWSIMSRGMEKTGEQLNSDELHLRAFWLQWDKLMRTEPRAAG